MLYEESRGRDIWPGVGNIAERNDWYWGSCLAVILPNILFGGVLHWATKDIWEKFNFVFQYILQIHTPS